jgi:opacity protein-like surface antigen
MKTSHFVLSLLGTLTLAVQAAPNDGVVGPYARVEVGRSNFGLSSALPQTGSGSDEHGQAAKLFGGYRFNENLGVEAGYATLGSFSESVTVAGVGVKQDGKARSIFGAVTGRLPLGESFALHGRLGLSSGKVSGSNVLPADDSLMGSANSLMWGVGAEYKPLPNVALTVNYDDYGHLSNKVKASSLVFGLHFWF